MVKTNIQNLDGNWNQGWALDLNTVRTALLEDGSLIIKRTELGEMLYRLKYLEDVSCLPNISISLIDFITDKLRNIQVDAILPIPPSDIKRTMQPVFLIADELSKGINIPVDHDYVIKTKSTIELKNTTDPNKRKEILKDAFSVKDKRYAGKTILLLDDLFSSGQTLIAVCNILRNTGNIQNIYVLTVTKTRVTR